MLHEVKMEFNIVSCVWCRYRQEFVAALRLQNDLRAMESMLLLLLVLLDTDFPMQPIQICEVSFDSTNCRSKNKNHQENEKNVRNDETYIRTAVMVSLFLNLRKMSVYVYVFMNTSENSCSSSADSFCFFR